MSMEQSGPEESHSGPSASSGRWQCRTSLGARQQLAGEGVQSLSSRCGLGLAQGNSGTLVTAWPTPYR